MIIENIHNFNPDYFFMFGVIQLGLISIAGLIGAAIARFFTMGVIITLAMKVMLLTFAIFILPAVFENFLVYLIEGAFTIVDNQIQPLTSATPDVTISLQNIFAYIAIQLQIPQIFSLFISVMLVKFALKFVPIVRL
jgi:hypothetical protein